MVSLRAVAGSIAVAAMAGAAFWWNSGADERVRHCEERAAGLSELAVLTEHAAGAIRSDPVAFGCDVDKAEAYAVLVSYAANDRAVVARHVEEVAGREGWTRTGERGELEAEKDVDGRRLSLRLSFPAPNTYEVAVRE